MQLKLTLLLLTGSIINSIISIFYICTLNISFIVVDIIIVSIIIRCINSSILVLLLVVIV